jgi:mRNA interferase RelE/StbE
LTGEQWSYVVTPPARRDLRRLDPPVKRRIVAALDRFVTDPHAGDIRKLSVGAEWRLRVGEWRVRFEFDDDAMLVVVTRVLPRGRAYSR